MSALERISDEIAHPEFFRVWHFSDITFVLGDVRSQGQSGKHLLALSFSDFDRYC